MLFSELGRFPGCHLALWVRSAFGCHREKFKNKEPSEICGNPSFWIWMFPKTQNGWFIMENPIKMDDSGVPLFLETPILWTLNFENQHTFNWCFFFKESCDPSMKKNKKYSGAKRNL